jgi:CspA family cold shock protein
MLKHQEGEKNMERFTGTIVWFSERKGFGFCTPDSDECNNGKDLFVHFSNIQAEPGVFKTLMAESRVSFIVGANDRGPQAEDIVVLELPEFDE